ncbi:MAG: metallophosphoesterase [Clostridia bacterium]|nr:metallophosphoesterase [Clostridia bacterium]
MSIAGIIFVVIVIVSFYGGANFYIGRGMYQWLSLLFPHINARIFAGAYMFFALSLIIGFLPLPAAVKRILSWLGAHWMGIFVYLLMLFLVADLVIFLGSILKIIPSPAPQSTRFYAGLLVILLTAGLVGYGIYNANQIQYVSYDVQTKKTAAAADMKIVLLSDLHLGAVNSEKNLARIVQGVNNLEPDLVCLAGDIFNDDYYALRNPSEAIALFKSITATYGVYACLGNHDGGNTFDEMLRFLEQSNIKLLNDEYVIIDERLVLFGRVDPSPIGGFGELKRKDITAAIASLDTDIPVIVMEHTPSDLEQYGREVDLVLAGHTHRGQIFPANLITKALFLVDYGHYRKDADSPHIIVTSGASTWGMPMRVGTDNEIVSILLH